jgi:6-phosphofructokinase 1
MKTIAVLTSGGDAPGMNAALRALVRVGIEAGFETLGVWDGFAGLMTGRFVRLGSRDVGGIIERPGTILGTTRPPEFLTPASQRQAMEWLDRSQLTALVVIGGNGSQAGAAALSGLGFPVVGLPATIDNDVYGSDMAIGVDTALNVALEAVDRLRPTAASHHRAILVEVMGRESGYLALMAGIAGGAEVVLVPEYPVAPSDVAAEIRRVHASGKGHAIIVAAEGIAGGCAALAQHLTESEIGFPLVTTTLGHVQRGGTPTAFDRLHGTRLGAAAVQHIAAGTTGVLLGNHGWEIVPTALNDVATKRPRLDPALFVLARVLGR